MKFESKPILEHRKVPLQGTQAAQLAEILGLVRAQGDEIAGHETHQLKRPEPRTLIGKGVAEEIAERAGACGADMVVIDAELSPSQTRNLEEAVGLSVCDREAVILNVFSRHARSRKARIQVEIAHLEYLRPRIRGVGLVMDQQAGGVMRGRGPGETASELLARQLDARLGELRKAFKRELRAGDVQRAGRGGCKRITLVGYTNAGKTTLMNGLTAAGLSARDMPFETLDTTSRCLTRHGGTVLLSDTVGFIRNLPDRLLASFESTMAEAREASLLAMVIDVSDPEWQFHVATGLVGIQFQRHMDDPNLTDKKYPGNPTQSYRSREPLRVTGEVADWQGHSPEAVQAMKDRIKGLEPIDD